MSQEKWKRAEEDAQMFVTRSFLKLQAGQVFLLFDNLLVAPTTYKLLLRTCLPKREKKNAFAPLHSQARSVTHLLDWSVRINLGLFCMQSDLLPGSTPSYWLFQSRNKGIVAFDGKEVTEGSKHFEIKTMLSIPYCLKQGLRCVDGTGPQVHDDQRRWLLCYSADFSETKLYV